MKYRALFTLPVIVSALGFFVDVYDLLIFSIVRIPSLQSLGYSEEEVSKIAFSPARVRLCMLKHLDLSIPAPANICISKANYRLTCRNL